MIEVAIVEDEDEEANALIQCLKRYGTENEVVFSYTRYRDAISFLEERKEVDIVFMDIMLPLMNGMEAAVKLRKYNKEVVLIFVTTMAQFAIKSYEVDASDYILKPVSYERVTMKLRRVVGIINSRTEETLILNTQSGIVKVPTGTVHYVETDGHKLKYHTDTGIYVEYGTLSELENILREHNFMRCNSCFLVNPKYIKQVKRTELLIVLTTGETLKISQPRRKAFLSEFANWLGQGKC